MSGYLRLEAVTIKVPGCSRTGRRWWLRCGERETTLPSVWRIPFLMSQRPLEIRLGGLVMSRLAAIRFSWPLAADVGISCQAPLRQAPATSFTISSSRPVSCLAASAAMPSGGGPAAEVFDQALR
jgi:hypothetical protein